MPSPNITLRTSLLTILSLGVASAVACGGGSSPTPTDSSLGGNAGTGGLAGTGATSGSGATVGTGGGSGVPIESEVPQPTEPVSPFIVLDQFGYLEDSEKLAVLRDPETGFDSAESYAVGTKYQLINAVTKEVVLELSATAWNGGAVHAQSGDRAWSLDFSAHTTPGVYYVLDVDHAVRSDLFRIASDVYRQVLRHAFRTFYYQRAGFAKTAEFAGEGWADTASHVGPGQDKNARLFVSKDVNGNVTTGDASTERDLSGAWYDAGDYNRYTPWTAGYVVELLRMYEETPSAFGDDFGIPESGNGTSDALDEAKVGLAQLIKTQAANGACISVLGNGKETGATSPPSAASAVSVYGPETTNATIRAGIAFAWGARVLKSSDAALATDLLARAEKAWDWAEANPSVVFSNTNKVAAGDQQSGTKEVALYKLGLAVALYRAGADAKYKTFFDANYAAAGLDLLNGYNAAWQLEFTELFLDYTLLSDATPAVKSALLTAYNSTIVSDDNLGMLTKAQDPYLAHVADYTWGSNAHKSRTGNLFHDLITYNIDATKVADARRASERYIHYLHGVNPLAMVYLSNMKDSGAHQSVTSFYHTWFADGSAKWDEVGVSTYGPPPGFLVGGPNPSYDWDGQCPGNAACPASRPTPPYGQPAQKSYANFNTNWPVNSWSVTENSCGYQVAYLRLLAKFVK